MRTVREVLEAHAPRFAEVTTLTEIRSEPPIFELLVTDAEALNEILKDCVSELEGVDTYECDPHYRSLCDAAGLTHAALFVPEARKEQQANVELGDLGELIGCLIFCGHFKTPPGSLFARNLAKPSIKKSESGYDIVVIDLDPDEAASEGLAEQDQFTAVESKASIDASHATLSYKAKRSFEKSVQEVQKILQMYMNLASDRFGVAAAVKRIPFFLVEFFKRTDRVQFVFVTTSGSTEAVEIETITKHLIALQHARCIFTRVNSGELVETVYRYRTLAS